MSSWDPTAESALAAEKSPMEISSPTDPRSSTRDAGRGPSRPRREARAPLRMRRREDQGGASNDGCAPRVARKRRRHVGDASPASDDPCSAATCVRVPFRCRVLGGRVLIKKNIRGAKRSVSPPPPCGSGGETDRADDAMMLEFRVTTPIIIHRRIDQVLTTTRPALVWYLTPWLGLYFSFLTCSDSTLIPETPRPAQRCA